MSPEEVTPTAIVVPWRTIFKLLAAAALVWLWLYLWELVLLLIVAVLISVTLDPMVLWLQRRGLSRGTGATLTVVTLAGLTLAFLYLAGSSLASQGHLVAERLEEFEQTIVARTPAVIHDAVSAQSGGTGDVQSYLASAALATVRSLIHAAVVVVLALILTLYLLVEGSQTVAWLLAFVPISKRSRARETMVNVRRVMLAYVVGNVATSVFATVVVLVMLSALRVPAAFLLALLAGIFDFLPVIGLPLAAAPAILLATTVSPQVALLVLALYLAYHAIENYAIAPWVYGDRLKLSNLAVILSFAAGAQIGGVIGALIALPIAAAYPSVEQIWLKEQLGEQVVEEHRSIETHA